MHFHLTKRRVLVAVAVAITAAGAATGAVGAASVGDIDEPITGPALDQASRVALDHLGEGRVTGTEVEDEESFYEVEVTLENGHEVDVQLDEDFTVVSAEVDSVDEAGPDAD